jgi:hypothetical protein
MQNTSRYGLPYPTGDDEVASVPATFQTMAENIDKQLGEVDDRSTPAGVSPIVRQTLADLKSVKGITGQSGYVTADASANNGMYVFGTNAWWPLEFKQPEYKAVFKSQDSNNFPMLTTPAITVKDGYIYLDLGSVEAKVGVNSFTIYKYSSGVKPSANISLGAIGVLANAPYSKTGTWNTSGDITVGPSMSAKDYLIALPRVIKIPDGVTFA